ncbi:MAG: N-acetylmuramoyl-L-alanine amidase [Patescibacteria group bacterium]|nr:N-acetylmuramoyl-L-alanine amidase [Patescibacteria group bacterium]
MRYYLAALATVIAFGVPWLAANDPQGMDSFVSAVEQAGREVAAVILSHNPVTVADLQTDYKAAVVPGSPSAVKILVVPGHEPDYGGAEYKSPLFGTVKERDVTLALAKDLIGYLDDDQKFQVLTTRDAGGWTPTFADYFKNSWDEIVAWEQANKKQFNSLVSAGDVQVATDTPAHADAPVNVALRLYGIVKWANDNGVDLMIHIHFNDYPGHGSHSGKYDGFAVYIPADDYENSSTTDVLAKDVFARLARYNPVSDWPQESAGIIHDQDLIATGSFDTANAPSMLIEYSYLYEPQLDDPATRTMFLNDLAYQTYLGVEDFFNPAAAKAAAGAYGTAVLPHTWSLPMSESAAPTGSGAADIFAMQTALVADGDYPPAGKSMNDCPRTGGYGPCTAAAVRAFQAKYGISGGDGTTVGQATLAELNKLFSK